MAEIEYSVELPDYTEAAQYAQEIAKKRAETSTIAQEVQNEISSFLQEEDIKEEYSPQETTAVGEMLIGSRGRMDASIKEAAAGQISMAEKYNTAIEALFARMGQDGWRFTGMISVRTSDDEREHPVDSFIFAKGGLDLVSGSFEHKRVGGKEFEEVVVRISDSFAENLASFRNTPGMDPQSFAEMEVRTKEKIATDAVKEFLSSYAEDGWVFVRFLYDAFVFVREAQ